MRNALGSSLLIHGALLFLASQYHAARITPRPDPAPPRYAFHLLQLTDPPLQPPVIPAKARAKSHAAHKAPVAPVLIQPDVPPEVTLTQKPLVPDVLAWSQHAAPPAPRIVAGTFRAPASRGLEPVALHDVSLSPVPELRETQGHLFSVSDTPVPSADLVVVPPANLRGGNPAGSTEKTDGVAESAQRAADRDREAGITRIARPYDGRHSIVVLGNSSQESYPETAGVLTGRIVYTVYLQVALPKNWILQFCLAPDAAAAAAAKGGVAALDAPWPFRIARPDVNRLEGDYTLVHGIVNSAGRFDQLALLNPDAGAEQNLLAPLRQWEFRPATRDGVPVAVEILLIIPHGKA